MDYKRIVDVAVIAVLTLLLGCNENAERPPSPGAQDEADIDAIHAFFEQYDRTWTDGLGEDYLSLLSDDIIAMVPGAPAIVGKKAVWQGMGPVFEHNKMDFVVTVEEVRVADDWAFARATFTFQGAPKNGEKAFEGIGKAIYILERQPDDGWKISRDIYNWDPSPEPSH